MFENKMRFAAASFVILLCVSLTVTGETWHLDQGENWKEVQSQGQGKYLLAVTRLKELLNKGQPQQVRQAWNKLKEQFPEIKGPDLDAFIEAEQFFAEGRFIKAVRSYDKFLENFPKSELYQAALDREFVIAGAFLAGRKKTVLKLFKIRGYAEGEKIMDKIADRAGNAPIAVRASIAVAKGYEERGKFEEAYQQWSQIFSKWPTGQTGKNALLAMARCKYSAYKGTKYDISALVSAKSYYENFKLRYPEEAGEIEVDKKIENISELLAEKQFNIARYYQKTGDIESAEFYYKMIIEGWPRSTAAKIAKKMIGKVDQQKEKDEK